MNLRIMRIRRAFRISSGPLTLIITLTFGSKTLLIISRINAQIMNLKILRAFQDILRILRALMFFKDPEE